MGQQDQVLGSFSKTRYDGLGLSNNGKNETVCIDRLRATQIRPGRLLWLRSE